MRAADAAEAYSEGKHVVIADPGPGLRPVRVIRIAKEAKLNTPALCGISNPAVNTGSATSSKANITQAKHSSPYQLHLGAHKMTVTAAIATTAPFCVVKNTAPTVIASTRKRNTSCGFSAQ